MRVRGQKHLGYQTYRIKVKITTNLLTNDHNFLWETQCGKSSYRRSRNLKIYTFDVKFLTHFAL